MARSPPAAPDLGQNPFRRDTGRVVGLKVVEPAVQLLALGLGQGHEGGILAKALSELLEKVQTPLRGELADVDWVHCPYLHYPMNLVR